ncbi:MAG TPA: D-alanyl-D-alanine carboxypeptidase/D-alanyl-D-alanine-endopeptidase [Gemmatimonadales bacterium]|jgi:D-alanyl-D-alanine carboxypeptidase/D-alanyl-D-alanine-endopeptidase (penicillin-binding protein 4)|nr:D-alanyl-D-alanine carboxypeptidase/D-alanyl-D-alanine-endopeptidase [Gemmatimonadales bacterium]
MSSGTSEPRICEEKGSLTAPLPRLLATILGVLILATPPLAAQKELSRRIERRIDAPPFNRQLWGVALVDERGRLVYGYNQDRLFVPASNTKLVVSVVASALLPPDWRVKTSLYGGPVVGGVLQGNLVLYGRGDPTMDARCYATDSTRAGACDTDPFARLRQLVDTLKAKGVRAVAGDVVGDGSYFEPTLIHPNWESFDLNWWYAAPVSGLGFNDNSVDFNWAPGPAPGTPALITMTPNLGDIAFENRTLTVPPGGESDIGDRFFRDPGTLEIWADGTVALDNAPHVESFALPDPSLFAARALRQVMLDAGIAVLGTTRSTTDSAAFAALRKTPPLAETFSRPVRDWIFPILNTSQNWFAEMLVKQLGKQFGKGGSWPDGLEVERRFLIDSVRVDSTQFSLSDGSGLSSSNLVSPLAFTQMLRFIRRHPRYSSFAAGLPQAGQPGSLQTRFVGTSLAGRVRAKTGSISRVHTLSGYIELDRGRTLTFSILANNHAQPTRAMLAQIDSMVVDMSRR